MVYGPNEVGHLRSRSLIMVLERLWPGRLVPPCLVGLPKSLKILNLCIPFYIFNDRNKSLKNPTPNFMEPTHFRGTETCRRLISFMYLAACIAIARLWKSPTISLDMVKTKLSWIMISEKLLAVNDKLSLFEKT